MSGSSVITINDVDLKVLSQAEVGGVQRKKSQRMSRNFPKGAVCNIFNKG